MIKGGDSAIVSAVVLISTPFSKASRNAGESALRWGVRHGFELNCANQADIAHVDDMRETAQRVDGIAPVRLELGGARQQSLVSVGVEGSKGGRTGDRVTGVRVSVRELDEMFRSPHERFVEVSCYEHRAHRDNAGCESLGDGHQIRRHAKIICGKWRSQPTKAGNDLIKNQENAMPVTYRSETLQIAFCRQENPG
jgi:hypothetical protein